METAHEITAQDIATVHQFFAGKHEFTDNQVKFAFYFALSKNGMFSVRKSGYQCSTPGSESTAANRLKRLHKIQALVSYFEQRHSIAEG